jgi:NAD-dependent deacetylase
MMAENVEKIEKIAAAVVQHKKCVFFTGAGISTESGIPDYRSKGGIWHQFKPVYFDEFMSSIDARIEYWRRKKELHDQLVNATPNRAHLAIAALYEKGCVEAVITQNIDGLHQESGLPDDAVVELHGNTRRVRCMKCSALSSIEAAFIRVDEGDHAPECACGGYLKPDTISFGQSMPEKEMNRAVLLSKGSRCFIVVGSTLVVQPASYLPGYARKAGAFLSIINLSETPYDDVCHVLIRGKAGITLQAIKDRFMAMTT